MRITSLSLDIVVTTDTGASEFTFRATRPIHFRAGQGGLIVVPDGGAKPFTFSSGDRSDTIAIATTLQSGSRFKRALADLAIGSRVVVAGAMGTLPAIGPAESQVLVAQGIGITPFLSMARSSGVVNASLLQVGAPHFFDEVAASVASAQRIDHRDQLSAAVVEAVADRPDAHWSLSGTAGFVDSVAARLSRAGVSSRRVHTDAFWGCVRLRHPLPATNSSPPDPGPHRRRPKPWRSTPSPPGIRPPTSSCRTAGRCSSTRRCRRSPRGCSRRSRTSVRR